MNTAFSQTPDSQITAQAAPPVVRRGRPLTERAGAATILGENAYGFEFIAQSGEKVYACYEAATGVQKYALEAVAGIVTSCNCGDKVHRRRVCKHMVELAVVLQTGLRTPQGTFVQAVSVAALSGPKTVADALRAMREDYHAAAARAVILTAAAVEELAAREARPRHRCVSGFDPDDWN